MGAFVGSDARELLCEEDWLRQLPALVKYLQEEQVQQPMLYFHKVLAVILE